MNDCAPCGTANSADATFCRSCGEPLDASDAPAEVAEEGFSVKWLILGVLIMFGSNIALGLILGIILGAAGVKPSLWIVAIAGMAALG